jgi:hypothetical protein
MKKRLLFSDEHRVDVETQKLGMCRSELNQINDFFKTHKLGQLNEGMIKKILKDGPGALIRDIYKDRIPAIDERTGLRNNKDAILAQTILPDVGAFETGYIALSSNDLGLFDFGETVELNEEKLEKYLERFRYSSDDPDILKAYDDLTEIASLLNKLNAKTRFFPLGQNIGGIAHNFSLDDLFVISPTGFQITLESFKNAIKTLSK